MAKHDTPQLHAPRFWHPPMDYAAASYDIGPSFNNYKLHTERLLFLVVLPALATLAIGAAVAVKVFVR